MAIVSVDTPRGTRKRDTETGKFVANSIKEFADKVAKSQEEGTALGVVQGLQQSVGKALIDTSTSTAITADNTVALYEQNDKFDEFIDLHNTLIDTIQEGFTNTVNAIDNVSNKILELVGIKETELRQARDQSTEIAKELPALTGAGTIGIDGPDDGEPNDGDSGVGAGLGAAGGVAATSLLGSLKNTIKKRLIDPLKKFFGKKGPIGRVLTKLGPLGRLLGVAGPIGLLISGIMLLVSYSKEITEALAPAIEGIKNGLAKLKPLWDIIAFAFDAIIKSSLAIIGVGLELAVAGIDATLSSLWSSFKFIAKLLTGILTGDMELIKEAWTTIKKEFGEIGDKLIDVFVGAFTGLVDKIGEIFGFENAWNKIVEYIDEFDLKVEEFLASLNIFTFFSQTFEDIATNIKNIFNGEEVLTNLKELGFNLLDTIMWPINTAVNLVKDIFGWDGTMADEPFSLSDFIFGPEGIVAKAWQKIKDLFSFEAIELPKFEMPNFSKMFDSIIATILPDPDGGWFARRFYDLFPDLKTLAAGATTTTNLSKSYSQITEGSTTTIDKSVDSKSKEIEMGATTNIGTVNNYVNTNSGNVDSKNVASKVELAAVNLKKEATAADPWGDAAG